MSASSWTGTAAGRSNGGSLAWRGTAGSDSVREVTRAARKLGLPALTLYAFSAQNWNRPPDEVSGLMDLLRDYLHRERPEIMDNGIRLHAIGELDRLPSRVRDPLEELRRDSAGTRTWSSRWP